MLFDIVCKRSYHCLITKNSNSDGKNEKIKYSGSTRVHCAWRRENVGGLLASFTPCAVAVLKTCYSYVHKSWPNCFETFSSRSVMHSSAKTLPKTAKCIIWQSTCDTVIVLANLGTAFWSFQMMFKEYLLSRKKNNCSWHLHVLSCHSKCLFMAFPKRYWALTFKVQLEQRSPRCLHWRWPYYTL